VSETPALLEILCPAYAPWWAGGGRRRDERWTGENDGRRVCGRIGKLDPTVTRRASGLLFASGRAREIRGRVESDGTCPLPLVPDGGAWG